jgi:hypothetical protein
MGTVSITILPSEYKAGGSSDVAQSAHGRILSVVIERR